MQVPVEWPAAVAELYQPVRVLGRGGFASVVLGVRKTDGVEHALKVVGTTSGKRHQLTANDMAYAVREIEILLELDHVNVVKLVDHWEEQSSSSSPNGGNTGCVLMALSYAKGPTLQKLLDIGGRLSLTFARVVCAQLVDVVEYLHGRAVVHRDIKPDNMIISVGSDYERQNEIWDDVPFDTINASTGASVGGDSGDGDDEATTRRWRRLVSSWKLTLIDFGFARALTPDDVRKKPEKLDPEASSDRLLEKSGRSNFSDKSLKRSLSRRYFRAMSAVGNRIYAAPEIINGVHDTSHHMDDVHILTSASGHFVTDVTRTLSDHVAYYGLLVDSYSVGNVIRYCMTGVAPDLNVSDTIALENQPLVQLFGCLCSLLWQGQSNRPKRRVQYRPIGRIPREVVRLIRGLTQPDSQKRTSMRAARLYPWVNDVLVDSDYVPPDRISYLSFADKADAAHTCGTEAVQEGDDEDPTTESAMVEA